MYEIIKIHLKMKQGNLIKSSKLKVNFSVLNYHDMKMCSAWLNTMP